MIKYSNYFKNIDRGLEASENVWKVLTVILWTSVQICCDIVWRVCIWRKHSTGTGVLQWSCLQTKEGRRRSKFRIFRLKNNQVPSTSSVWQNDHGEDYRSSAWHFTTLYRSFLKRCTLCNKAVGTIWLALSKPFRGDKVLVPAPLIGSRDSFSLWTWARV